MRRSQYISSAPVTLLESFSPYGSRRLTVGYDGLVPAAYLPVRWLWVLSISERDRQLAKERGSATLVGRLAAQGRSWIVGP